MCLIFMGQGYPRKLFNLEHFPIYGKTIILGDMMFLFIVDSNKCPFLDAPTNGFVVIQGFRHGDNASYFCNADYIVMSGDHV